MRQLSVVGKRESVLKGRQITYTLKRSQRAKYLRLEIRQGEGLIVVMPRTYDLRLLEDFLQLRSSWIVRRLEQFCPDGTANNERKLMNGDGVPYLGRELRLVVTRSDGNQGKIAMKGDELLVVRPSNGADRGHLVEIWYRWRAATFFRERVSLLSRRFGLTYGRITVRGQKTRWGSCSRKGNLSFNWRLLMAPANVVDYVIIHELAHLREMNHTARFWKVVAEQCPSWREDRRWLSEHGTELSAKEMLME
jgi:predicted metal-dependent hydrolase